MSAGLVGAAIRQQAFERGWIKRQRDSRAVEITPRGRAGFRDAFGFELA